MSMIGSNSTTAGRTSGGGGGFFGNVSTALGEAVGSIAKEQLPVWAAKELNLQRVDQLNEQTFVARDDVARIDDKRRTTGNDRATQSSDIEVFGQNVSMAQVVIVGVGLLGLVTLGIVAARR